MCKCINYEKDEDYDIPIDSECYNHDYDDVYTQEEDEQCQESDILFE